MDSQPPLPEMHQPPPSASAAVIDDAAYFRQNEARRLTDLVTSSQSRPLHVHSIRIDGITHTRSTLVEQLVSPILQSETLGDVIAESREACQRLNRLGVFRDVAVTLDTPPRGVEAGGAAGVGRELVDVVLTVKEGPRFYARTGADFSNYDTTTNITTKISNALGGGEYLEANASYAVQPGVALNESAAAFASETGSYFQLLASKPLLPTPRFRRANRADPEARIEVAAYNTNRNAQLHQSHDEQTKGLAVRYKTADPYYGNHEFAYDVAWRHLHNIAADASGSIRKDAGHTLKSALSHSFTRDHRDDPMLPTQGTYVRVREELAGLGGDVQFAKGEAEGQYIRNLGHGFTLSSTLRAGLLMPLPNSTKPIRVNDRFVLGGPNSVRGFAQSGVGPVDKKDSLGGTAYYALGLSLFAPLPRLADKPIKAHFFANAGSLLPSTISTSTTIATPTPTTPATQFSTLLSSPPSVSAGVGLAVRFSILRLELNYCLPLVARAGDRMAGGLQFGVGVSYM
ncbi:hypothetical protein HDU87_003699 [Geranomyces variabilis]|uniref:Bacterial surface antigen (D15) domain-containing protein n=1 Tax=Geranomyces variabilis TaxID=109894 RepID=A0AAD5XMA5_9FUNG|nr:hypothetical protein HDU87_003699 [Geranomyces variabilis]